MMTTETTQLLRINDAREAAEIWTLAYRTPRASTMHRVTDWAGTWQQAFDMAGESAKRHPELQVWYVTTAAHEADERERMPREVAAGTMHPDMMAAYFEDHGNVLVDSGRRVRLVDNGSIDFLR